MSSADIPAGDNDFFESPDCYADLPQNHVAWFDGEPGLVWYAEVRKVRGDALQLGDWLDSLDHRGARMIYAIAMPDPHSATRRVGFSAWHYDLDDDWETVRCDVEYDVVNPNSQVTPDGGPVVVDSPDEATDHPDGGER